ncbi:MAG TPA: DUF3307 domain-containing protein [Saprospiraceae bacterium]|nr:DUF3307 domain-containing protein [Saprospiraceae bacterium]
MTAITLFLYLLTSHLLGDFVFQPKAWVDDKMSKGFRSKGLIYHILIHALLIVPLVLAQALSLGALAIIIVAHYFIDLGKIYAMRWGRAGLFFFIDQLLHISVLLFVSFPEIARMSWGIQEGQVQQFFILLICVVLLTRVSGIIIHYILKPWSKQLELDKEDSLEKAGTFIGNLERLFVFFLATTGQLTAIGFLVAAKSVFRFGDLQKSKGRKLTEYVLIGTMLSFGFALTIFLLYNFLNGLIT